MLSMPRASIVTICKHLENRANTSLEGKIIIQLSTGCKDKEKWVLISIQFSVKLKVADNIVPAIFKKRFLAHTSKALN